MLKKTTNKLEQICYKTIGDMNDPCIILINGLGGQLIHWPEEFIQGLSSKGFYIIIFDNRDIGLSQRYESSFEKETITGQKQYKLLTPPYMLEDMAKDVLSLLDELQIKQAHMVGLSMGGMISQIMAILYPERVSSLTCIASSSSDPKLPPLKDEILEYFFSSQRETEGLQEYIDNRIRLYKAYNHPDNIPDNQILYAYYMYTYQRSHRPEGIKRQLLAMINAGSRVEQLKKVQIPSLIIHGDYDPVFSVEHGKQLAACLPNNQLKIIPNLWHGLPVKFCPLIVDLINEFCQKGLYYQPSIDKPNIRL